MPNRSIGHLAENRINDGNHKVILLDFKARGFPVLTEDEIVAELGTRRMLSFLMKRGVVVETTDGRFRVGKAGQRYADMIEGRESRSARRAKGEVDIVVAFPQSARDVAIFHPRTKLGVMLVDLHPLTTDGSKVEVEAAGAIVSHMRADGAIVENRTRPGYRGGRPASFTVEDPD